MASVIRVSILGAMPGGEVWSVNPVYALDLEPVPVSAAQALTLATSITAIAIPTGLRQMVTASTTFTGTRVEARDRNGLLEAQAEALRTTPTAGTGATPHPYQTAVVSSLRTGFPGGQGRGRIYWPATSVTLNNTTLRVDAATVTSIRDSVKTYLVAIGNAVGVVLGGARLCVWSRTGTAMHSVTGIRVGDVVDTQRRRRDALNEIYSEVTYP